MRRNGGVGNGGAPPPPPPADEKRCIRSDGRGWRCKSLKFQGLGYCEKHYQLRMKDDQAKRDKQDKVLLQKEIKRNGVDSILYLSEEEEEEEDGDEDDDDQRCDRNDGRGWRCKSLKFQGQRYCEKHYEAQKKMEQKRKGVDDDDHEEERCTRHNGREWRCKGLKFEGHRYCEKHHNEQLNYQNKCKVKGLLGNGKKRKGVDCILDSSEDDDEEEVVRPKMKKRKEDSDKGFHNKRHRLGYGFSNSSVEEVQEEVQVQPTIMKKNYTGVFGMERSEECSISELILSLKTSFRDIDFEKVVSILKLREENVKMEKEVAEKKAAFLKEELETCEINFHKMWNEVEERKLKEDNAVKVKIGELELEKDAIKEELHRFKRMCTELTTKNMDLESDKRRAGNEIDLWKKKFQDSETKGFSADVSNTEEGKKNLSRQLRTEGRTDWALARGCLSNIKIKEEVLDFNANVYASTGVTSCLSSAKESGVGQHAELGVKDGHGSICWEQLSSVIHTVLNLPENCRDYLTSPLQ